MLLPIERCRDFFAGLALPAPLDEATDLLLGEIRSRLDFLVRVGPRLPDARPPVAHALGRRGAAHQPDHRARHLAREHAVRARRAVDRPAPARHAPRHRGDAAAARQRQFAAGRRARSADHAVGRPRHRPRAGAGRARRPHRLRGHAGRACGARRHADRAVPVGPPGRVDRRGPARAAQRGRSATRGPRRERAQPARPRRRDSAGPPGVRHGRVRLRQVDAGAGRALRRRCCARRASRPRRRARIAHCSARSTSPRS